jgi:BirA family biotin operon repressor/biotin-[acetyl-CoA-carboxylase] ligase
LPYKIIHYSQIDSTNSEVERQAACGAPDGLWVRADAQTAGRGRRGRSWISPIGNLYATGLVRLEAGEGPAQQLSFVAALAVHDSVAPFLPDPLPLRLKWPNDLLLMGRKLAGILLESGGQGTQMHWVAVGIGINLAHHPEHMERPATSLLAEVGTAPEPGAVLEALAERFIYWRLLWRTQGFAVIRTAWLERCAGLGEAIEVRLGTHSLKGCFKGLDNDGALLLEQENAILRPVYAGDVFGL